MTPAATLEHILHSEIPISHAMGIRVTAYDGTSLKLAAPIAPNTNDKGTAFGGSLYAVAVLCGWGMLHLKLAEAGLHKHIVIHKSSILYLQPVDQEMQAECCMDNVSFKHFLHTLEKHDRARLSLDVVITCGNLRAVEFSGQYVVHG